MSYLPIVPPAVRELLEKMGAERRGFTSRSQPIDQTVWQRFVRWMTT
jgi:hypothetical protein